MEWLNSPSDLALVTFEDHDNDVLHVLDDESDNDLERVKKRRRVS